MILAPPYVMEEIKPRNGIRAWKSVYCFDTTDNGRLEPLQEFYFELREEPSDTRKKYPVPYRLYVDDGTGIAPCFGGQWQSSVERALSWAGSVTSSYAHHRRDRINADRQAHYFDVMRDI